MDIFGLSCCVSVFILFFCLVPGDNNVKEVEVKLGLGREANNIMTAFNQIEETETLEDTSVLTNLQKILTPGLKNQTSSSSSSESYSSEDTRSSMSRSSSSSESSSSSTSSEASRQTLVSRTIFKCATMKSQKVWEKRFMCSLVFAICLFVCSKASTQNMQAAWTRTSLRSSTWVQRAACQTKFYW